MHVLTFVETVLLSAFAVVCKVSCSYGPGSTVGTYDPCLPPSSWTTAVTTAHQHRHKLLGGTCWIHVSYFTHSQARCDTCRKLICNYHWTNTSSVLAQAAAALLLLLLDLLVTVVRAER
jgi:hypothetical protein